MKVLASHRFVASRPLWGWLVGCVFCLLASVGAAQQIDRSATLNWVPSEMDALLEETASLSDSPLALAPLLDLHRLGAWMNAEQVRTLIAAQRARVRHPIARSWIDYSELRFMLAQGDIEGVRTLSHALGFVASWAIVGPFRNDGMAGFSTAYEPETEGYLGQDQTFAGKFADLHWLPNDNQSETGFVAANERIADAQNAVLYAVAECEFSSTSSAVWLSVDGAYRLWVDGHPTAMKDNNLGGVFVRDHAPVQAKKGWHQLFLKVATEDEDPGWHIRFVDAKGKNIVRQCRVPQGKVAPVAQTEEFPKAQSLSDDFQTLWSEQDWDREDQTRAAYILKTFQHEDKSEPWKKFLDDEASSSLSPLQQWRRAKIESAHWRKVRELETIDYATVPAFIALYANQLLASEPGVQAQRLRRVRLAQLRERFPQDPRVLLAWMHNTDDALGGFHAHEAWRTLLLDFGPRPALCHDVLAVTGSAHDDAHWWLQQCAKRSLESVVAVKDYVRALGQRGELAAMNQEMQRLEELWVNRLDWQRVVQMVAAFQEDWSTMLASIDQEMEQKPNDADSYQRRADLLLRLGRYDEAAAALRTTLSLRPQSTHARKLLAYVEEQKDLFYTEWRVSDEELKDRAQKMELQEYHYGNLVHQRVVQVYDDGLSSEYNQEAWVARTREGAEAINNTAFTYDPNEDLIQILSVRVLGTDGGVRETYNSSDYRPYEGTGGMYIGMRNKSISIPGVKAGDIVSIEYVKTGIAVQNMFDDYFGDVWFWDAFVPTSLARYVLYTPEKRSMYIEQDGKELALPESKEDGRIRRMMELEDIPALKSENATPGFAELTRVLHVSTYRDVDAMANWYWNLVKDQLNVSADMIKTVQELTRGIDNQREKVRVIYAYVVRNIRYVALQFGIDGWRPRRTTQCYESKYGDCKATAALLKAMLGVAGVPSHLVLIRTRELGRLGQLFPGLMIYNHMILYVPDLDMYLDGTATFAGMDETPGMDQGASALIIKDGRGGQTVTTPFLSAELNVDETWQEIDAREENITGRVRIKYIGENGYYIRATMEAIEDKRRQVEKWLTHIIPKVRVEDVSFEGLNDNDTPVSYDMNVSGGQWFIRRGDELVVQPFGRKSYVLTAYAGTSTRTYPVALKSPSIQRVHFELMLPPNVEPVSFTPGTITHQDPDFGQFTMKMTWDDAQHVLRVDGHLRWHATEVSPEDYERFRVWTRKVEQSANQPIVFKEVTP